MFRIYIILEAMVNDAVFGRVVCFDPEQAQLGLVVLDVIRRVWTSELLFFGRRNSMLGCCRTE